MNEISNELDDELDGESGNEVKNEKEIEERMRAAIMRFTTQAGLTEGKIQHQIAWNSPTFVTRDYSLFVLLEANRPIVPKKVDDLVESMAERGFDPAYAVVVTEVDGHLEVKDGQHRVVAGEKAQVDIYYKLKNMTIAEAAYYNSLSDHWSKKDFMHSQVVQGNPNYLLVEELMKQHDWLAIHQTAKFLSSRSYSRRFIKDFEQGLFVVDNLEFTQYIIKVLEDFSGFDDRQFFYTRQFVAAIRCVLATQGYRHKQMLKKLQGSRGKKMVHKATTAEYLTLLQDIYNYREDKENWITFWNEKPSRRDRGGRFAPSVDDKNKEK